MSRMYNWGNMSKVVIVSTSAPSWQFYCITGFQHCFLQRHLIYKYLIIVEEMSDFTIHWQFQTSLKQRTGWRQNKKLYSECSSLLRNANQELTSEPLSSTGRVGVGGGFLNLSLSSARLQVQGQYWCILHPSFSFGLPVQNQVNSHVR